MTRTSRASGIRFVALALGALALIVFSVARPGRRASEREYSFAGLTMGTTYSVRLATRGETEVDEPAVDSLIRARLAEVVRLMSTYDSTSELSRFNRDPGDPPFALSGPSLEVLDIARTVSEQTGGAFDPTVAPLVDAWGFGPVPAPSRAPDDDEIARLRERVGFAKVLIDAGAGTAAKLRPDVVIDLSAIAKGYGVDRVADALEEAGFMSYLVEVGGEVRVGEAKPSGEPWRVAVEAPVAGERAVHAALALLQQGIATSGDYRATHVMDGERYAHIIDPRTGRAILQRGFSVSVVHQRTVVADAWATALVVLGPDEGFALATRAGIAALFLTVADGQVRERATAGFPALIPTSG